MLRRGRRGVGGPEVDRDLVGPRCPFAQVAPDLRALAAHHRLDPQLHALDEGAGIGARQRRLAAQGFSDRGSGPHRMRMAFLQRVINGGGQIDREYGLGRGALDLRSTRPWSERLYQRPVEVGGRRIVIVGC